MDLKLKKLALAVGLSLPAFASADTLLCLDENPCYMSNEPTEMVMELGDERPIKMKFEQEGNSVSLTYSEARALARTYLFGTSPMDVRMFKRKHRGQTITPEMLPHLPLSEHDRIDFRLFNTDLVVVIVGPHEHVIVRRGEEEGGRIEMSFDNFIAAAKEAYIATHDADVAEGTFGGVTMTSSYSRLAVLVSTCTTSGSGSNEAAQAALDSYLGCRDKIAGKIHPRHQGEFEEELATPELGEDETSFSGGLTMSETSLYQKYQTFKHIRAYYDLEGETPRDMTYYEKTVMDQGVNEQGDPIGGGGYTMSRLSKGGDNEPTEPTVRVVNPQVVEEQSEARTTVEGRTVESGIININVQGEEPINTSLGKDDYYTWMRETIFKRRAKMRSNR